MKQTHVIPQIPKDIKDPAVIKYLGELQKLIQNKHDDDYNSVKAIIEEVEAYLSVYNKDMVSIAQNITGSPATMEVEVGAGIIETGSNTNGRWIKFSDGTMMQWGYTYVTQAVGMTYPQVAYPVAFTSAPAVVSSIMPSMHWDYVYYSQQIWTFTYFTISTTNNGDSQKLLVHWQAIGRWKA